MLDMAHLLLKLRQASLSPHINLNYPDNVALNRFLCRKGARCEVVRRHIINTPSHYKQLPHFLWCGNKNSVRCLEVLWCRLSKGEKTCEKRFCLRKGEQSNPSTQPHPMSKLAWPVVLGWVSVRPCCYCH